MPRQRNIGRVKDVEKVWLSKKELAAYLGVSERYVEENLNTNPKIEMYRISPRCVLYRKENIDWYVNRFKG